MIKTNVERNTKICILIHYALICVRIRSIEYGEDIELRGRVDIFFRVVMKLNGRNHDALLTRPSLFKSWLTFQPLQHR